MPTSILGFVVFTILPAVVVGVLVHALWRRRAEEHRCSNETGAQQRKIQESERLLKHITANVPGVVYQFQATSDHRYRNPFVSEKAFDLFGLKGGTDDFFESFVACLPEEEKTRFIASVVQAIENIAPWHYQGRFIRPDGKNIWFSGNAIPHRQENDVVFDGILLDITDQVMAERALKSANRMLTLVLDTIPVRVFWKDRDGRFLGCNRPFAADAGLERPEDLIGKDDFEMSWRAQAERYRADDLAVMASGEPRIDHEEPQTAPDGEKRWLRTSKVPMRDGSGAVIGLLGTYHEITALKQAEEENRKRQKFLESVLYHAPDAIVTLDAEHLVVDWNPGAEAMFGYTRQETLGRNLDDLVAVPGEAHAEAAEKTRRVLSGDRLEAFETVRYRKDGRPLHVIAAGSPVMVDGVLTGVVAVYTDITAMKTAERALRESENRLRELHNYLRNIVDSMPSVLVGVDNQGRVTQWNRQAERETGIPAATAAGRPFDEVFPCMSLEMGKIRSALGDRRIRRDAKVARRRKGEMRYEDVTVYPLVANGVDGAVIRVDDVTERVRLEEMMIQSEKMLSVGGLAAGMAHEINNPLAGMIQTTLVATDRLFGDLPANDRAAAAAGTTMGAIRNFMTARGIPRMLETVLESGRRAAEIVENMLGFARKSDSAASSHDMNVLLDRTLQLAATDYNLKKQYDFRNIQIVKEYAEKLPPVPCEGGKIQQVFLNLLKNGAEAMHGEGGGGRRPRFVLRTALEAGRIRIDIEDNGPGMGETVRKRVFEPFFTTKPVGRGTGLGLSVSYFIVTENHGGEMTVASVPGKGTCFTVRLPLERPSN